MPHRTHDVTSSPQSKARGPLWKWLVALAAAPITMVAACSLLIDKDPNQCTKDADCSGFAGSPVCQNGVCVSTGLGPPGCVPGPATKPEDFQNLCSKSQCIGYDNCKNVGLCNGAEAPDASPPPDAGPPDTGSPPDAGSDAPSSDAGDAGDAAADSGSDDVPTELCADPAKRPNVIYVTGSSNFPPFLELVAPLVTGDSPSYTIIFQITNSCTGVKSVFSDDPEDRIIKNPSSPTGNYASYYNADGSSTPCLLDPDGNTVDVGESEIYASTCDKDKYGGDHPDIADYQGPIEAMTFVVPAASSQHSISEDAARMVFGLGGAEGKAEPWTDPQLYFIRSSSTATNNLVSRAIHISPKGWWGVDRKTAKNLADTMKLVDPAKAERAIGILSADFADSERSNLRILAFQAHDQLCGYLPDSSPTTRDKANVRDGHYPIWGPIHLYTRVSSGEPSAAAGALVTRFAVPRVEQELLDAFIDSGNVPKCAMRVATTEDLGALASFSPEFQCGCYFDFKVNGASSCQKCSGPLDCPVERPACNIGYCEFK